ncbi:polyketide cyclase/dehydrase/lipid transport protein [Frondihabitans sp. PhB188]|uniref:SRPBCC family protein n=1 Tax=Frondihabitans sp. PhB188 TaxID=2485200 RepID=UPI000FACED73|nr:SRPBCC family protein [Frondihabitans sp. PhB188]ROQ41612.1 polyketide cyclase/dehydrase/lipid transport protein [Frondihabitans sp. PhB188]
MSVRHRFIAAPPEAVFEVLADGWLFPSWVVGASRIRGVDDAWPAVGAEIHHSFGVWPAVIDDTTHVVAWDAPRHAHFVAQGWPIGEATVIIDAKPRPGGCVVRMEEYASKGPGRLVPAPLMAAALNVRNVEALRRLAWLAEGRAGV